MTFLPQFIPAGVTVVGFSVLLAAIHATEGIIWFLMLIFGTRVLATWLQRPGVILIFDRLVGAMLIGFGLAVSLGFSR